MLDALRGGFHCKGGKIVHRNLSKRMVTSLVKGKFPQDCVCVLWGKFCEVFQVSDYLGFTVYGTVFSSLQSLREL